MGDIADFMIDSMIERNLNFTNIPIEPNYSVWHTRKGNVLKISEMTSQHISNTIKMLKKGNSPYKNGYIKAMEKEMKNR